MTTTKTRRLKEKATIFRVTLFLFVPRYLSEAKSEYATYEVVWR